MQLLIGIFGFIAMVALFIGLRFLSLETNSFFMPKERALETKVYKESEAYNDGMLRDLQNLQMEYVKADAEQKAALKSVIIHRFSVYDINKLPPSLQLFYNQLTSN